MKRKIIIPPSGITEPKFLLLVTWLGVIPFLLHYGFGW